MNLSCESFCRKFMDFFWKITRSKIGWVWTESLQDRLEREYDLDLIVTAPSEPWLEQIRDSRRSRDSQDGKVVLHPQGRVSDSDERRYRANHSVWSLTAPNSGGKCRSYTTEIPGNCWWCSIVWDVDLKFFHRVCRCAMDLGCVLAVRPWFSASIAGILGHCSVWFRLIRVPTFVAESGICYVLSWDYTGSNNTDTESKNKLRLQKQHPHLRTVHTHPFIHNRPFMSLLLRANP